MKKVLAISLVLVSLLLLTSAAMADRGDRVRHTNIDECCPPEEEVCPPEEEVCPPIVIGFPEIPCPEIEVELPEVPCVPEVMVEEFPEICCPEITFELPEICPECVPETPAPCPEENNRHNCPDCVEHIGHNK